MDYRKESHYIVAYDKEGKMKGKWDILTNEYIGVKGMPIKSKPQSFARNEVILGMQEPLRSAYDILDYFRGSDAINYPAYGSRVEEIISVGLMLSPDWETHRSFFTDSDLKLNKRNVKFIKDNYAGVYSHTSVTSCKLYVHHQGFIDKCGELKDWVSEILAHVPAHISDTFTYSMITRAIHEKIYYNGERTYSYELSNIIREWDRMETRMGFVPTVKPNILSNFKILKWTYGQYLNTHYDETLKANNDLPWLYYEDENYIIRPLVSKAEFHAEATAQHNCVESFYMERVSEGLTHVVTVRKKTNPDKPYITCEVNDSKRIVQFLLACNQRIDSVDDFALQRAYQEHLTASKKD